MRNEENLLFGGWAGVLWEQMQDVQVRYGARPGGRRNDQVGIGRRAECVGRGSVWA